MIIHVLDARDPLGTRCKTVENHIKKEAAHKHLVFVLNKCDLVPTWVTSRWIKILSKEYPTIAFHASINNSFGKGSLIQLLRQFSVLHSDKKQISVGFVGYPNTGKSSIINTLRAKKVCTVAPIPGETKVWQYITLMRRIYLIDCPGVVQPSSDDSETEIILKGVVRIESIKEPENHVQALLDRVKVEYIKKTYGIQEWKDSDDFLTQYAKKTGKLLKGAEPDLHAVAKMILHDWLRGKIPYFRPPPLLASSDPPLTPAAIIATNKDTVDVEMIEKEEKLAAAVVIKGVNQIIRNIRVDAKFSRSELRGDDDATLTEDVEVTEEVDMHEVSEPIYDWDRLLENVEGHSSPDVDPASAILQQKPLNTKKRRINEDSLSSATVNSQNVSETTISDDSEDDQDEVDDDELDDDEAPQPKKQRISTNKKKATNYYTDTNVKNRNRRKVRPVDPKQLEKKLKGDGKRRR